MSLPSRPVPSVLKGAGWMVICLIGMSLLAIAVRQIGPALSTPEIMFYRGLLSLPIVLALIMFSRNGLAPMTTNRLPLHIVRNLVHFGGQFCWVYGITFVPLALAFALEFTMPIWISLLAPLLLGERLTPARLACVALGFVGILIAVRPDAKGLDAGTIIMLLAALGFALSVIGVKRLTTTESPLTILFYMALIQTPVAWLIAGVQIRLPDSAIWGWLLVLAGAGLIAQFAMARAYLHADASVVMPIDYLRLPLIAIIGAIGYQEPFDPFVLVGGAVILAGNWWNFRAERGPPAPRAP